jgi:hypothetical protein
MLDKLNYIEANGKKYPFMCSINVLEVFQEEYGSIKNWSQELITKEREGNIKELKHALKVMINEGIDIQNECSDEKMELVTEKQVGRILTDAALSHKSAFALVTKAMKESTSESKNNQTTRNQTE